MFRCCLVLGRETLLVLFSPLSDVYQRYYYSTLVEIFEGQSGFGSHKSNDYVLRRIRTGKALRNCSEKLQASAVVLGNLKPDGLTASRRIWTPLESKTERKVLNTRRNGKKALAKSRMSHILCKGPPRPRLTLK